MAKVIGRMLEKYRSLPIQVKASVWFLLCSFLQRAISVITTPIFTRLLTPEQYGQFSVFYSYLNIVIIFVTLNVFYDCYIQGLVKFDKERDVFSSSLQGLTTTMVLVWTVVYTLFRGFWNNLLSLTTVQMYAMLVLIWSSAAYTYWAAEQRVRLNYKRLVILTLAATAFKPALEIFFVIHAEDKVTARILGFTIASFVAYVGMYFVQMRRGKKFFSARFWKYALVFNIPLLPHYLSAIVLSSADRIMIARMVGESEAGIYSLAYSLSFLMYLFNWALTQTMTPWLYQKIKDGRIADIHSTAYMAFVIIALANVLLMALAPEAVAIFAPKAYYEAIWIIPPVSMGVFFMFGYEMFAPYVLYCEKTKYITAASVAVATLNIGLNLVFIRKFGYIAAGYTTMLCYLVYAVILYLFMTKVCRKNLDGVRPYNPKVLVGISAAFCAIGFYFLFTYNHVWLRYGSLAVMVMAVVLCRKPIIRAVNELLSSRRHKA